MWFLLIWIYCCPKFTLSQFTESYSLWYFFLNWSIIACCVSFCCTTKWISYVYSIPPPSRPSLTPVPPTPRSRSSQGAELSSLSYTAASPSCLCYTWWCIYANATLPMHSTPFPLPVSTCLLSTSLFLPWKWVHLYYFSRFHMYALINDICFSLSHFTLYDRL